MLKYFFSNTEVKAYKKVIKTNAIILDAICELSSPINKRITIIILQTKIIQSEKK